jgi:thiamine biosynthesis lipoprotein
MGTRFEIVLPDGRGNPSGRALRAAGEAAIDEILIWHQRLNRFAPDSLVSHLGRSSQAVPLDRETFDLFADALEVWRASAGAFDITVTPVLVRMGAADSAVSVCDSPRGSEHIRLDAVRRTIRVCGSRVSFDLGGIAKGHALDCAATRLRAAGVPTALLHGGTSSVLAMGRPPGYTGWRVALGPMRGEPVVLEDMSLSLSDPSGQVHLTGRIHIVDPRTALQPDSVAPPAAGSAGLSVAVIGPSARLADAWSTALAVLGRVPGSFPRGYEARLLPYPHIEPVHAHLAV